MDVGKRRRALVRRDAAVDAGERGSFLLGVGGRLGARGGGLGGLRGPLDQERLKLRDLFGLLRLVELLLRLVALLRGDLGALARLLRVELGLLHRLVGRLGKRARHIFLTSGAGERTARSYQLQRNERRHERSDRNDEPGQPHGNPLTRDGSGGL